MRKLLICLFVFVYAAGSAQEIKPKGYFLQDTMQLAQPVQYSLSVTYPSNLTLLFPDSSFNFQPFEFRFKQFFTTETDRLVSKDSVIYTVASFELDKVQKIRLPIYLVNGTDSVAIFPETDSIIFQEKINQVSDSLKAIEDTTIVPLDQQFNYPYFIIGLVSISIIILVLVVIFGGSIWKKWKIYRLERLQKKFELTFKERLRGEQHADSLLNDWKMHCEKISKKPFTKLTTKEIYQLEKDQALERHLQIINRKIYSSSFGENIATSLEYLLEYSSVIFQQRVNEIKND